MGILVLLPLSTPTPVPIPVRWGGAEGLGDLRLGGNVPSLTSSLLPAGLVDVPTPRRRDHGDGGVVRAPSFPSSPYPREWKEMEGQISHAP